MADDSNDRTLWCGNLHEDVTEELLYELFLQAGPLESVKIPTSDGKKKTFAFIRFCHVESVPYTIELMGGLRLYEQKLRLQCRPGSVHEKALSMSYNQPAPPPEDPPDPRFLMAPPGAVMYNPLAPPMAAVLSGTNFHRSVSVPSMHDLGFMQEDNRRSRHDRDRERSSNDRDRERSSSRDRNRDRSQEGGRYGPEPWKRSVPPWQNWHTGSWRRY